jgi:uncharacterized protein (DUF58 family)
MWFERFLGRRRAPDAGAHAMGGPAGASSEEEIDDLFLSRLRRASLVSRRTLTSALTGEHDSPRKASAMEFADYRSYTPGDDFRRVDWNAYLRLDHLLVKMADAPERVTLHILMDGSKSMDWGLPSKFGYARRLAIGLSYVSLSHMDTVNLMLLRGGECVRVSQQESAKATPILVRIARGLHPEGTTDLNAALHAFTSGRSRRGVVVLISDLLSPGGYQTGLERLSRSSLHPIVIHLLSPDELNPTLEGDMELQDVETEDTVQVSLDWATKVRYQQWLREWLGEIEHFCLRRGITYIRAETSHPIEELLLGRLRREKVLR